MLLQSAVSVRGVRSLLFTFRSRRDAIRNCRGCSSMLSRDLRLRLAAFLATLAVHSLPSSLFSVRSLRHSSGQAVFPWWSPSAQSAESAEDAGCGPLRGRGECRGSRDEWKRGEVRRQEREGTIEARGRCAARRRRGESRWAIRVANRRPEPSSLGQAARTRPHAAANVEVSGGGLGGASLLKRGAPRNGAREQGPVASRQ